MTWPRIRFVLSAVLWLAACQPAENPPTVVAAPGKSVTILVTSNGWHTGIAIARGDLPAGTVPEAADFPDARYFEFGWGDAEYYPASAPTIGMAFGAAMKPTPALVHLMGLAAHPREVFPKAEAVELRLTRERFRDLSTYLHGSFARDGAGHVASAKPGLHRFSKFYPATGEFHLFNTCNNWTARALAAAGLDIGTTGIIRAESLMNEVRRLATQ
jgi:uncharacterized protein (TIGR02117 family)